MIENEISLNDVKTAYRKLKSMAYYDTNDLYLKDRISDFESGIKKIFAVKPDFEIIDFEKKLKEFHRALTSEKYDDYAEYWDSLIKQINYRILPKKVKAFNDYKKIKPNKKTQLINSVFTNVREIEDDEKYEF